MASSAFNEFRYNVLDAKRLHQAHGIVSLGTPGKKGLGHLTRSGVVMLCAAWERYNESVIVEAVSYLAKEIRDPNNLPLAVRKHLSAIAKQHLHELKPMELAGDGWRKLYVAQAIDETSSLNTPKSGKLKDLYERLTGLTDVSAFWTIGAKPVDDFVSARGDIAHNGRKAPYITTGTLQYYIQIIEQVASEHDNKFCDHLKAASGSTYQPWRRTA
ncbi:MAG: HEPN domain-containing protein [Fluviibacter sp.]|jgi:RiboL-PSP-HEPN